jgi:hypothetical protein
LILISCVDDGMGTLFNHRRQSQDQKLRERILQLVKGSRLWMNDYSARQFSDVANCEISVSEFPMSAACTGEYCFVEGMPVSEYESKIEKLILYRWNRQYPADTVFGIPLKEHGWDLISSMNFPGSSHDRITEDIYVRHAKI